MNRFLSFLPLIALLASCTTLPRPKVAETRLSETAALQLLRESSARSGNPWQRLRRVTVRYEGAWTKFAENIQPAIVDPDYRQMSDETYLPRQGKVIQIHRGPAGTKQVVQTDDFLEVRRNGKVDGGAESREAAAMVADAYVIFTFGSSALLDRAGGWKVTGHRNLGGERCVLISGTARPGFGMTEADGVIAWIGEETKRLHRVQISLSGVESAAGADVDVTYADFQPGAHGTEWPRHFIERVRRPLDAKAHEWRMTALDVRL